MKEKARKISLIICVICVALVLTGCSQAQSESTDSNDSGTEETGTPSVKNEEEIIPDLSDNQDFYLLFDNNCYDFDGYYVGSSYVIDELTITRRKIDQDNRTDDVYVTITASSSEGKYIGDFHLLYSLYDVGGWYLENIELEAGRMEAISQVSEADAFNVVLTYLSTLGAGPADCWIEKVEFPDGLTEIITAGVDFTDDVFTVNGELYFYYRFDGENWLFDGAEPNLNCDFLIDGTYQCTDCFAQPQYLTITHENGNPVVSHAHSWDLGIDPFHLQTGFFDGIARTYYGTNDNVPFSYYFGADGIISYYLNGMLVGTFHRITDPTTDTSALWTMVKNDGIA